MKKYFISLLMLMFLSLSAFAQVAMAIEAENATLTGSYDVKSNTNASGGTFITLKNPASLSFEVNGISQAGTYQLDVYHFNGGLTQEISLDVNGSISTVVLQPSNWAYQGSAQITSLDIHLNEGINSFTFNRLNTDVSLDHFQISDKHTTYYISTNGDDNNDGLSESKPWKTIDQLNLALANDAQGGWVAPGNKVLFKRGDTFYGHLFINRSGTADNPITISSYGDVNDDLPIISGSGGTITGGDYFQAITMANTSNMLLTNLWIKNDRKDGSRYNYGEYTSFGIKLIANKWGGVHSNVVFRDLKISDVFGITIPPPKDFNQLNATGIRLEGEANQPDLKIGLKDITIEDCFFTHIGKAGVWAVHKGNSDPNDDTANRNQNIVVRNNTFYQTGGSGVILSKTYNGLIENNEFDQTGYSDDIESRLVGRGSGAWVWSCRNIIAQYNRSYGVRGPGDSYGMHIDFGNKDIIFQYNYSENTEGGFCEILGDNLNSTYRFNVSVNDGYRDFHGNSIWISDFAGTGNRVTSNNNYVYNNTIYLDKNYTPDITITSKNTYVYNNIFMVSNGQIGEKVDINIDGGSQLYVSNNLFQGNINNAFTKFDSNAQSGNPLFQNIGGSIKGDYIIQTGSPAVNNGKSFPEPKFPQAGSGIFKNISPYPETDAFGEAVNIQNDLPNIGASNAHNSNNSLAIGDLQEKNIFTIYPNPVKDNINVLFSEDILNATAEIFDIQGKSIFSSEIKQVNKAIELPKHIKNGIYFLRIIEGNRFQTSQFILYR
ncbi:MAG: T9SS type A sorting domain-containing protein [Flavobacteriaceae bacterium]|nr:T9SS type A sorting domain-containing protein [Flavobacteriaceae bacterium]